MLRLNNLKLPLEATSTHIKNAAADKMHCAPQDMQNFKISKNLKRKRWLQLSAIS